MRCSAGYEVCAGSKVSLKGTRGLRGEGHGLVQFVASQEGLAFCIVDEAAFGSRGPGGGDPTLEAACAAGGQQVVQAGPDRLSSEDCVMCDLGDAQRLVPP